MKDRLFAANRKTGKHCYVVQMSYYASLRIDDEITVIAETALDAIAAAKNVVKSEHLHDFYGDPHESGFDKDGFRVISVEVKAWNVSR